MGKRLEYLIFTGTQYIDTGILCTQDTGIEVEFLRETAEAQYLYGAVSEDNKASVTAYLSTGSGNWRFGGTYASFSVSTGKDHSAAVNRTKVLFNGSGKSYVGTVGTFVTPHSLLLGTNHTAAGGIGANRFKGKLYRFRMTQGETPVLDLVPWLASDGTPGLQDRLTGTFYPNEGTGAFGYGHYKPTLCRLLGHPAIVTPLRET